ncbi:MAG: TatD family hydrolase [Verrucomicrobiota bacterium]|nr:TatD family hydrolase [Verrucomicrobiota bacterium]
MNYYDAHNHFQDYRLDSARPDLFESIINGSIAAMTVNGTCEADWESVLNLGQTSSRFIPSIGLHPWFTHRASPDWKSKFTDFAQQSRCVGEIGLDQWIQDSPFDLQKEAFEFQLRFAVARNYPITIHCLKAWGSLLKILRQEISSDTKFLLHSFAGSREILAELSDLGAYFSISGYFAHERKRAAADLFKFVPIDKLLIETDAPDMLPPPSLQLHPLTSQNGDLINSPANLPMIYQFTAELLRMPLKELAAQFELNFKNFYSTVLKPG